MIVIVGMAIGLTLIQAIGAYLRYLPLETRLPETARARLGKYILLWMPVALGLYIAYFLHAGLGIAAYKQIHYWGWIPFFAFSLVVIRNEGMRHTFVAGMQMLWFLLLQTVSGTLILTILPPHLGTGINRIVIQTALYIFFFLVLLPVERRFFRNLLPPGLFSGNRVAGWCFALLPLGLCATPLITLMERPLMYTWSDRVSRFFLLFSGFVVYQYAIYAGQRLDRIRQEQHTNELLNQQLQALENHAALLHARAEDVRRVRHDLRHYNRLVAPLLDAGESHKARELIEAQDRDLLAPPLAAYCDSPIVNAALTVYAEQARADGIPMSCKVKLNAPERDVGGDNDLAILLSNVIENAVIASRKQPEDRREISLSLSYVDAQYVLSLENRCDTPLRFGADGLPTTRETGHGAGMASLRNFAEKYAAEVDFEQKDGVVSLMIYWLGQTTET